MSDSYVYIEFSSCKKNVSHEDSKARLLKLLIIILTAVLIIEALLYVVVFPCFSSVKITVSGLKNLDPNTLIKQSGMNVTGSWVGFDTAEFVSRLESLSAVESVSAEKKFPNQVIVRVNERKPVAVSVINSDTRSVLVQIDKNGVIFDVDKACNIDGLPLITGLDINDSHIGLQIDSKYWALTEQLSYIAETCPVYLSALSEINVVPTVYDSYELVLFPIHSQTRILADRTLDEELLQRMMVILDVSNFMDSGFSEVDMRYGCVSFRNQ